MKDIAHNCFVRNLRVIAMRIIDRITLTFAHVTRKCGRAMIHSTTRKADGSRYRYYVCTTSQKSGVATCSTGTMSAVDLEKAVTAQIRALVTHPQIIEQVIAEADTLRERRLADLATDAERLRAQLDEYRQTRARLEVFFTSNEAHLVTDDTRKQYQRAEEHSDELTRRLAELEAEHAILTQRRVGPRDLRKALGAFDPVWEVLYPVERARITQLIIESVDVHRKTGTVGVTFRPSGILALRDELTTHQSEGATAHVQ